MTGVIIKGGFFTNQTIIMSLIGNHDLCAGPQAFGLLACPTPKKFFYWENNTISSE